MQAPNKRIGECRASLNFGASKVGYGSLTLHRYLDSFLPQT